ncbi:unnamed protein product [Caenorhabditis bovis]|uniref:Uncharacterized protein n=1 Tax=Caenorhabditis bovis TaxID=2654633 RepID=A0A8S1EB09_9PELO|nr:unnamed protein product [Caenorhabditis bovis]
MHTEIGANYYAPRRSISTVTGPNRREMDAFYSQHFRNKKDEISFDPIRFSPPHFTPPPSFPEQPMKRGCVRFDDLQSHPQNNFMMTNPQVPPRKCSLAPNFFSSQNSHHVYPDQYTPRTWPHNDNMASSMQLHHQHPHNQHHPPQRMQARNYTPNGLSHWEGPHQPTQHQPLASIMKKVPSQHPSVQIRVEHSADNSFLQPSNNADFRPMPNMLSPMKMDIDEEIGGPSAKLSTSFLISPLSGQPIGENQHKRSHPNVPSRKASIMALKSQLRNPRGHQVHKTSQGEIPYTPPPILAPMRNGSGLFCSIAKSITNHQNSEISDGPSCSGGDQRNSKMLMNGKKKSDDGSDGPSRKNGFTYMAQQINQPNFADELEALRKESWASTSSQEDRPIRKKSIDPEYIRKISCMSDTYYDMPQADGPHVSDPNPHINVGREYQARVRKWNEREVHPSELDAIEDRDEIVFSSSILDDIDPDQITAFELLACSQACPRAGRNKELALHLLMENKGNIDAAVEDLLRCDTLDWEHYSIVFGYLYNDSVLWTPEEVYQFQDAIYKSEKDFDKVAQELPGKTIKECVQFYYTWKKTCPDDYRKLRNLRRKRRLLEMNLQAMEDDPIPMKKCSLQESVESDAESDTTTHSVNAPSAEFRDRSFTSPIISSPRASPLVTGSPMAKDFSGIQKNYQPLAPRHHSTNATSKKGAQPSADGFFHCRLCDKCFEKVKSLNAHMKSHAMKARAEQEAKAHDAQMAAAAAQLVNVVSTSPSPLNPFANSLGITIPSSIGNLTPQQLCINQQLQSQLSNLSSQLNSPMTPQQQLQLSQQQLVARAMQQSMLQQAQQPTTSATMGIVPQSQCPLLQTGLHSIH